MEVSDSLLDAFAQQTVREVTAIVCDDYLAHCVLEEGYDIRSLLAHGVC